MVGSDHFACMLQSILRSIALVDKNPDLKCNFDFKSQIKDLDLIDWKIFHESLSKPAMIIKVKRVRDDETASLAGIVDDSLSMRQTQLSKSLALISE